MRRVELWLVECERGLDGRDWQHFTVNPNSEHGTLNFSKISVFMSCCILFTSKDFSGTCQIVLSTFHVFMTVSGPDV